MSPFAIAARLWPAARSRLIRSIAYWDILGGRPSRTPCARLAASACRVRCEIRRRSKGAKVASRFATCSPAGVVVWRVQSRAASAQPCCCALASRQARSSSRRERLSSFQATSAFASANSSTRSASWTPGRLSSSAEKSASSTGSGSRQAAAPTRCRDRPPLRLEAGAAVLPVGAHPTTRDAASQLVSSSAPLAAARAHLFSHSTANTRCYTAIGGALPSVGSR